jgi:hypothetical protein
MTRRHGNDKAACELEGMTAYGYFRLYSELLLPMIHYQHRHTITCLDHKLYPPGGSSAADLSKGIGGTPGFVDYGTKDDLADRVSGRGAYADPDDSDVDQCDY